MPVSSKVMPGSLAPSVSFFSRSSARASAPLQALDGQPVAALGVVELAAHLAQLGVEVALLLADRQRDPFERRAGQDDGVPVAGRDPGDEHAALVAGQVVDRRRRGCGLAGRAASTRGRTARACGWARRRRACWAMPRRRSSIAPMTISAVLPAPTSWASSTDGSETMRATAAVWCSRGVKVTVRPGSCICAPS